MSLIRCYEGKLGSGKTNGMVAYCMDKMIRGKFCIANVKISFHYKGKLYENYYCDTADKFEEAIMTRKHCVVAIDEAGSIFSASRWNKLSFGMTYRFRINRKFDVDLVYTAQSFYDVVKPLRKLTDHVVCCRRKPLFGLFWNLPRLYRSKRGKLSVRWDVPATLFVYNFVWTTAFTGGGLRRRNFWEYCYRTDVLYPRDYVKVWRAYDTMDIPDPYVMVKEKNRKSQVASWRTPQTEPNKPEIVETATKTLQAAEQEIQKADLALSKYPLSN